MAVAASLWIGILAGRGLLLGSAWGTGALAVLIAIVALRAPRPLAGVLLVAAAFLGGACRGATHRDAIEHARAELRAGALIRIAGSVAEPPGLAADRPIVVVRVTGADPALAGGTRLRLLWPAHSPVEWGDRVECLVEIALPARRRNPGGWDAREGAEASGVAATGRAITVRRAPPGISGALLGATLVRWRRGIEHRLAAGLSPRALELVLPLVTGDRSALSTDLSAEFRAAGLIHLLALSGLHVSALAAVARSFAATLGGGVTARALAGVAAALFYAGLAGPLPSLARAVVTECWLGGARTARLAADPAQAVAISALFLLALNPGWSLDLGFQLSCAASLGLATLAPFALSRCGRWRAVASPFATTLAAQVVCAPILMARTHGLSWPALFANLVAVPTCGLLLAAAWLAVLVEGLAPGCGHVFFSASELLSRALLGETAIAARWPAALVATGHDSAGIALAFFGVLLLVVATLAPADLDSRSRRWPGGREALLGLGALLALTAVLMGATQPALSPAAGTAWIVVLDVGQGDAIAIVLPDGCWLVDTGPRSPHADAGERAILPFLRWAPIRRLGGLVLTHDDSDHTGGARALLRGIAVESLIGPVALPGIAGPLEKFSHPRPSEPRPDLRYAAAGDTLHRDPWVVACWPPREGSPIAERSDNASGLVLELRSGTVRALFTADVDSMVENALAVDGPLALLKAGHHGSASSSGAAWLARVRPAVAVISAGERNVYGHPSPRVLERLIASGARVDRTDREGALWYEVSAAGLRRLDWRSEDPGASARGGRSRRDQSLLGPARAPRFP